VECKLSDRRVWETFLKVVCGLGGGERLLMQSARKKHAAIGHTIKGRLRAHTHVRRERSGMAHGIFRQVGPARISAAGNCLESGVTTDGEATKTIISDVVRSIPPSWLWILKRIVQWNAALPGLVAVLQSSAYLTPHATPTLRYHDVPSPLAPSSGTRWLESIVPRKPCLQLHQPESRERSF
jgi:hypothetical protein